MTSDAQQPNDGPRLAQGATARETHLTEVQEPQTAKEAAECRNCRRVLRGKPFWAGGSAYDPKTGEQAKVCHYGGFVCSRVCDYRACLELEQSMPGHTGQTALSVNSEAWRSLRKWDAQ